MKKKIDLTGKRFGNLVVLEEVSVEWTGKEKNRKTIIKLKCVCDCGSIFYPFKTNVNSGKTTGCIRCSNCLIVSGKKIGELTVLKRIVLEKSSNYLCRCDCGSEDLYKSQSLKNRKRYCCDKCRFPKKYAEKVPKKSRKESIAAINYLKHIKTEERVVGSKIGKLKITSFSHWEKEEKRRRAHYNAKCKCGNTIVIRGDFQTKSCGCLHKEKAPRGEDNIRSNLTNSQAQAIKEFKKSNIGYTQRQIAQMFGVSEHVVSNVITGATYKN